ncbi:MAG: FecR domain-containing protein [Chitinophagaceae bacterium]|nr:FecR domain-containing protein [Chitinophagaceae bacterium]
MHPSKHFFDLLERFTEGVLTPEEEAQLAVFLIMPKYREWLDLDIRDKLQQMQDGSTLSHEKSEAILQTILNINKTLPVDVRKPTPFLRRSWLRYAAAILIILSVAGYIWNTQKKGLGSAQTKNEVETEPANDIPPGVNKAILILADGAELNLDSVSTGVLSTQGGTKVVQSSAGNVIYTPQAGQPSQVVYNTIWTPKGGQFKLVLPDGSAVWLNAASSITFPTAFTEGERVVKITGEVYFEVAKNKRQPFFAEVNGARVEALGTHFNINAYEDEAYVRTTLLEGRVRVSNEMGSQLLAPGQQAIYGSNGVGGFKLINNIDVSQVVAWKNGFFEFDNMDLPAIMRQIGRWYDVEIIYQGTNTDIKLGGGISRNLNLQGLLSLLNTSGVYTRLEGRKLIVDI